MIFYCIFFFSSRRRHTRSLCDWSSDVCSSDLVDVDEAKGLAAIDCEWANGIAEGADLVHNRVGFRVRNRKNGRPQAGKIDTGAIRSVDRVMRAGIELDLRDYVSGCSVDDVPVRAFEGRHVEYFSVR